VVFYDESAKSTEAIKTLETLDATGYDGFEFVKVRPCRAAAAAGLALALLRCRGRSRPAAAAAAADGPAAGGRAATGPAAGAGMPRQVCLQRGGRRCCRRCCRC